jgi:hypothetical protein
MPDVPTPKFAYRQIIALDTRFVGNRHSKGAVLYSAEARDLRGADVVLVITRNGDDMEEYIQHAKPGQVCRQRECMHTHVCPLVSVLQG